MATRLAPIHIAVIRSSSRSLLDSIYIVQFRDAGTVRFDHSLKQKSSVLWNQLPQFFPVNPKSSDCEIFSYETPERYLSSLNSIHEKLIHISLCIVVAILKLLSKFLRLSEILEYLRVF